MPRYFVTLIVAVALFMETMDSTVIATSLPAIAVDLHQDPIALKLALTSYLLSLAVFIPLSGWMADRFGARTVFRAAIVVFTLGSALCGFAQGLGDFVLFRVIQGMGGAMMVPVGRLVILRTVPKAELISALAWLTIPALMGPVIGPPLGGFITTYISWRWIFWINIPVGLVGITLATLYVANIREEGLPPLDVKGFILSGIGLAGLAFGLTTIGQGFFRPRSSPACSPRALSAARSMCGTRARLRRRCSISTCSRSTPSSPAWSAASSTASASARFPSCCR